MEKIKLKSASELLLLVQDKNKNDLYDYIDKLHDTLLNYQLIIDIVAHNVRNNVDKIEIKKDF